MVQTKIPTRLVLDLFVKSDRLFIDMNKNVFHDSKCATYFDNGDGSLAVVRKGSWLVEKTVGYFKNDNEGQAAYRRFRSQLNIGPRTRVYKMYRCPTGGRTYDDTVGFGSYGSRRGNIRKADSRFFAVIATVKRR